MNAESVLHAVQLAVAPVFMLAAVAGMIGTVAARLARIVDRARVLEERVETKVSRNPDADYTELGTLRKRGSLCNQSIAMLTLSGVLIGATVMTLFIGEIWSSKTERLVPWTFLGAVAFFIAALALFLVETWLATHTLRFAKRMGKESG